MSLKLRIALIIGLVVCVPGMCLMINKLAETSPDEVRESINMRVNSERQLEQPKSKYCEIENISREMFQYIFFTKSEFPIQSKVHHHHLVIF